MIVGGGRAHERPPLDDDSRINATWPTSAQLRRARYFELCLCFCILANNERDTRLRSDANSSGQATREPGERTSEGTNEQTKGRTNRNESPLMRISGLILRYLVSDLDSWFARSPAHSAPSASALSAPLCDKQQVLRCDGAARARSRAQH